MATPLRQHYRYLLKARDSRGSRKAAVVLILDRTGRIVRWNRAAEALTGYPEEQMVGQYLWDELLFQQDIEPVKRQFRRIISGLAPGSLEYRWKIRGGAARWMACSNFEKCVSPGGVEVVAFNAIDVTETRRSRDWRSPLFGEFQRTREAERHRMSSFLHDTIAQTLVALSFSLEEWKKEPETHDADRARDLVERCCRDVRLLTYMLAPAAMAGGGLAEAIGFHVAALRESGALDIDFRAEPGPQILSEDASAVLFSAVHEVTARAITTRRSRQLAIVLKREGLSALLEIKGAFNTQGSSDCGCPVIRERVAALGGSIETAQDTVRIAFPIALAATSAR